MGVERAETQDRGLVPAAAGAQVITLFKVLCAVGADLGLGIIPRRSAGTAINARSEAVETTAMRWARATRAPRPGRRAGSNNLNREGVL